MVPVYHICRRKYATICPCLIFSNEINQSCRLVINMQQLGEVRPQSESPTPEFTTRIQDISLGTESYCLASTQFYLSLTANLNVIQDHFGKEV